MEIYILKHAQLHYAQNMYQSRNHLVSIVVVNRETNDSSGDVYVDVSLHYKEGSKNCIPRTDLLLIYTIDQ